MVRCSIYYDKDIKEQVFMIRGDERYARSTKTTMEIGNPTLHSTNFDLSVIVDVYRDVGNASVVIYDNDEALYVIDDWQSTDTARTISLTGLGYDADHNLYAKYIGNGQCSPSSSKAELVNITNPYVFDATLDVNVPPVVNGSISNISIMLVNDEDVSYSQNQQLKIYYDGTLKDTVTTDSNGEATTSISNVGNIGLHELQIVYEGSLNLTPTTNTTPISVGYKLEFTDYPYIAVHFQDSTFKVKVTDFFNNPIANESVSMTSHFEGATYSFASATSNNQGIATLTGEIDKTKCDGTFTISNELAESVELSNIRIVDVESLLFTSSAPRLYYGETISLYAEIEPKLEGVPVILTRWTTDSQNPTKETIYTNANGIATKNVTGEGNTTKHYTVDCGDNMSPLIDLEDYYTYYSKINEDITKGLPFQVYREGSLISLQNVFRIDSAYSGNANFLIPLHLGTKGILQMEGIVSSSSISITITDDMVEWFDTHKLTIPARKYTNGKIIVEETGQDFIIKVYDNNNLINTYTVTGGRYLDGVTFSGGRSSQLLTFRRAFLKG